MPSRDLFPSDWLVTGAYRDTRLGVIKTGKESEVHLVARIGSERTTLLAEKRFKARPPILPEQLHVSRRVG